MSFLSALGISKLFGGTALTDEERADLMQEVMMKTLARAAASDTNIKSVEIDKVEVLLARTGVGFLPLRYASLLTLLYSKRYLWINTWRISEKFKA